MSAAEILADLARRGIRLEATGERLRYFPRSALTPDLLARLKAHKPAILAALAPAAPCPACGCPIFVQHPDGRLACGLCHPRPEGARLVLVVHRPDGTTAWRDYHAEREAVAADAELLWPTGRAGFQRGDMEQAAPDRDFRGFATGVGNGDVQSRLEEQGHLGVSNFVALSVGETDSKRLKGPPLQPFLNHLVAHTASIPRPGERSNTRCRCGSTAWRDVPIHDGQSVRRDCARCGRFLRFTVWRGVVLE